MSDYPTEEQLKHIRDFDVLERPVKELVEYIEGIWHIPEWGFRHRRGKGRLAKRPVMKLQLHTGGWSGNEDIIGALQKNGKPIGFWGLWWHKSIAGGHFWFEIPLDAWDRKGI